MTRRRLLICGLTASLVFAAVWHAGNLLSSPVNQPVGDPPSDLTARAVQFPGSSGTIIHGWFIQGREGAGVVLLMHGVRANRLSMLDRARFLARAGYSVLLFDFQAHGESAGEHITFGYLESRDARAAAEFLRATLPREKIGVLGVSMGGAAFLLASPPVEVNAAVLEMVYPTMDQAIANRLKIRLGDWAGVLTPLLSWQLKPRLGVGVKDLRPVDHAGGINAPKLFIAGAEDRHTTLEESRRLFAAAREPKELWVVEGARHVDLHALAGEEYERRVLLFFEKYLRG